MTPAARPGPSRRAVVGGLAAGAVAGCARQGSDDPAPARRAAGAPRTVRYGPDPAQVVSVVRPADDAAVGLVLLLHGGFWLAEYTAQLAEPLVGDLRDRGWVVANVEYRRVGVGGGVPATLDDVSAALDVVGRDRPRGRPVVVLGHSAGGQLAAWLGGRHRLPRWRSAGVRPTHVVTQAGVLDLVRASEEELGGDAVAGFVGGTPDEVPEAYASADPTAQLPPPCPVWCVHGTSDGVVPPRQSSAYVEAVAAAGGTATLVEVPGDHFDVIDPATPAWRRTLEVVDGIAARDR